jgi:hypothetical protein
MRRGSSLLSMAALALVLAACQSRAPAEQPTAEGERPLEGAWRIVGAQSVAASGKASDNPTQESLVLFADGHYSIAVAFGDKRVAPYAIRWRGTDAERLARISSIVVNAGTYEATPSTLVTRPLFALVPEFVGGSQEYQYELSGNRLTLRQSNLVSSDGVQNPDIVKGQRTVYTLERIK